MLFSLPPSPHSAIHTTICRPYISHVQVLLTLDLHEVCMFYRGGVYRTTRTQHLTLSLLLLSCLRTDKIGLIDVLLQLTVIVLVFY